LSLIKRIFLAMFSCNIKSDFSDCFFFFIGNAS
jgi:hypothetical protein